MATTEITIDFSSVIDLTKLKQMILHICKRGHDDPSLGAVKLNKVLYYADFVAHRELGHSITGATYQNLAEGPAPKELLAAREELEDEEAIDYEERPYFTRMQKRIVCRRDPDLSHFTSQEIRIVDEVIDELWELNATELTDLSHREWGWRLTDVGETIHYRTAWLSPEPLTQEQIAFGIELWKKISA